MTSQGPDPSILVGKLPPNYSEGRIKRSQFQSVVVASPEDQAKHDEWVRTGKQQWEVPQAPMRISWTDVKTQKDMGNALAESKRRRLETLFPREMGGPMRGARW